MSYKSNGIKLTKCDSQQWKTASVMETPSVKLAGEEAKDRLYEPKHKKKVVRVLTVVAYVFFVSLAAIMLSLYYVFLWNGDQKVAAKLISRQQQQLQRQQQQQQQHQQQQQRNFNGTKCENSLAEIQRLIKAIESQQHNIRHTIPPPTTTPPPPPSTTVESTTTWYDEDFEELRGNSNFFKKLLNEYPYNDID